MTVVWRRCALAAVFAFALQQAPAFAQTGTPPPAPPAGGAPQAGPLTVRALRPNVYWVQGGVGNAGFVVGDKGVVVVDATISAASAQAMLAEIAKVTPKPVTTVILTHGDVDHTAGLAGFPAGLKIYAHRAIQTRIAAAVAAGRSRVPADRVPNVAVDKSQTLTIEGVRVQLLHWAPAHTDGDLVVYLPDQGVVFTGDIFALDQPRAAIHTEQGGTSSGWIETVQGMLALNADRFVVGHGDVQTKPELKARLDVVVAEKARVKALAAQGKSLAEIQADVGDPPPGQAAPAPGGPRFTAFSKIVYDEMARPAVKAD